MTHQFKFGDRVRNEEGKEFVYLRGHLSSCTLAAEDGSLYGCLEKHLTPIPHPDTERIDWLAAQDDIDITLGNTVQLKPCLRANIDAAMQEQAAEAKE